MSKPEKTVLGDSSQNLGQPPKMSSKEGVVGEEITKIKDEKKLNKINSELSRMKAENEALHTKLKEVEEKSTGLVFEIKANSQKKVQELQNALQLQKTLVAEKEEQIAQLEKSMKAAERSGSKHNLHEKSTQFKGEEEKRSVRSVRGSISLMESQLSRTTSDLESKIKEMGLKHAVELANLKAEHSRVQSHLKEMVSMKDVEIGVLEGRLEQSRLHRESSLKEMDDVLKKYVNTVANLETEIREAAERYKVLEREKIAIETNQREVLLTELESVRLEKNELSIRLDCIARESEGKQRKLEEMAGLLTRMENSIAAVEQQKVELLQKTTEYIQKNQAFDKQQGAVGILQEQLEKSQKAVDEAKEELAGIKHANRGLEKDLQDANNELNKAKMDHKILSREAKELESKLERSTEKLNQTKEKKVIIETDLGNCKGKITELEQELNGIKIKMEEQNILKNNLDVLLLEKETKLGDLQNNLTQTLRELEECKEELKEVETLKSTIEDRDKVLTEKDLKLEEKDRLIGTLKERFEMQKEISNVLDAQLDDLEGVAIEKSEQLNEALKEKAELEGNIAELKEELKKAIELNEKSLETVAEKDVEIGVLKGSLEESRLHQESSLKEMENDLKKYMNKVSKLETEIRETSERYKTLEREKIAIETNQKEVLRTKLEAVELEKNELSIQLDCIARESEGKQRKLEEMAGLLAKMEKSIGGVEQQTPQPKVTESTPRRILEEQRDAQMLEEKVVCLKKKLADLQAQKKANAKSPEDPKSWMEGLRSCNEDSSLQTVTIFEERASDGPRLDLNCVKHFLGDIYLLGADQGLFSRRLNSGKMSESVRIRGITAVHQIELVLPLNIAIFIEGNERKIAIVDLGPLRVAAEAATCSKPNIKVQILDSIQHVLLFQVQRAVPPQPAYLVCANPSRLCIFYWDGTGFVLKRSVKTQESVTCLLPTRNSVVFGTDKIYELDFKTLQLDEFIDEGDKSLFYVMTNCREFGSYPIAILDVGMSNLGPGETRFRPEYLLCFPDLGIFVDNFGRRSRSEDIIWSKLPVSITYRHPNLFVVHFTSLEIIQLNRESFTRVLTPDGESAIIPKSIIQPLSKPKLLGSSPKAGSILVGTLDKVKSEVLEMTLPEESVPQMNKTDSSSSVHSTGSELSSYSDALSARHSSDDSCSSTTSS